MASFKVLDLTRVLAGPFCTMILSDLGAEVIKVEIPGSGDDARHFGPFKKNQSLYFLSLNRGKKSISLNLKTEKGKKILLELIKKVDVLVENFRPGIMEKLGLGYEELRNINPRLIYAAASGFGHTGPYSQKPAYDILAQAMGGIMSITGWPDSPPTRVGISIGDIAASLFTAIGIMAALYDREKTGKGQKIDVSMLDSQVAILENALTRFQVEGVPPRPLGNRHPTITPFQAFKAKDDDMVIAVGNDILWEKFCIVVGRKDLITDEKYRTNPLRTKNINKLIPILQDIIKTRTVKHWLGLFEAVGIPCGPINKIDKVIKNPQLLARNMIVKVKDHEAGVIKIAGNPIKMTSLPDKKTRMPAPRIGEHNLEVFSELLCLSEQEIEKLKIDGII